jgi:hypothetical protein
VEQGEIKDKRAKMKEIFSNITIFNPAMQAFPPRGSAIQTSLIALGLASVNLSSLIFDL